MSTTPSAEYGNSEADNDENIRKENEVTDGRCNFTCGVSPSYDEFNRVCGLLNLRARVAQRLRSCAVNIDMLGIL